MRTLLKLGLAMVMAFAATTVVENKRSNDSHR